MSVTCVRLSEATLSYPTAFQGEEEEVTLWDPGDQYGVGEWLQGVNTDMVFQLVCESGLHWDHGPYRERVQEAIRESEDPKESIQDPEIAEALDQWRKGDDKGATMDDLHSPSLFTEWDQGVGEALFVGADQVQKNMKVQEYTPEMLAQREELNWCFNFLWNIPQFTSVPNTIELENPSDQVELLELVAVGDNHGVAKCKFGAVFVPKGALTYLQHNGGTEVGTTFDGEITFTPGNKFPWRLARNGIKYTYAENTYGEEDY